MFIGRGHACVSDLAREHGMKDRKRIARATTCGTTTAGTRAPGAAGTRGRHPSRRCRRRSPGGPRRSRSQGWMGGACGTLQLHRQPCDFCHAADFLRDSLSAEPNFCSLVQIDYRWGMLHEITGRQTFDCPRRPQDECEPGGRVLEGAKGDCRQATCNLVDAC